MHLPEGRPSEGTGHGSGRATGGTGFGLFGHPAKRWWAFSEACGRSRTVRRYWATVRSSPDLWARVRAGAGRLPQGTCRKAGCWQAREPFRRFISRAILRCCAFRSAREGASNVHLPGIPANAVGGGWNERSAESVTRTREVRAVVVPKGMRQPVGWVRSFRRTSLQPAWIACRQQRRLRRRLVLGGRGGHCRQTSPQDAGATRRWQRRDVGAVGPYRLV